MKQIVWITLLLLTAACSVKSSTNLNSVLWVQTAAEYQACSFQAYNAARRNLDTAVEEIQWTAALEQSGDYFELPPAVIFDVDETVFDNSAFQAQLVLDDDKFRPDNWDSWVRVEKANAISGAAEFIIYLQDHGIEVVFITNRKCRQRTKTSQSCPQEDDTLSNLNAFGITGISTNNILLQNEYPDWGSEKKSRREFIAQKYRILMIFGDDLGDFIPNVKKNITPEKRKELATRYSKNWGSKWFILPNPMYGSWHRVLKSPPESNLKGISEN